MLAVTELKQWVYCRRIVYYHQVMGASYQTFKMEEGGRAQEMIEGLEMRRTLREYRLEGASRQFGVWLANEKLGLRGKVDLLLRGTGEAAVVDFKLTSGEVRENHRMQLAAYSLLVEAELGLLARVAFLFRIPDNRVFPVEIGADLRERVRLAMGEIARMRETEVLPEPTEVRGRCVECEYANYCGDVW